VLPNPWLLDGVSAQPIPQVFLALQQRPDGWVEVQLPSRPNGGVGWIRPGSARLLADQYSLSVSLSAHRITVFRSGKVIYAGPAATGAPKTPTPTGLFYIRVLLHTDDRYSPYGPYAYGLSAHSNALNTFNGSDAEIGVHGNNDPSVLGQSVTHGCVRIDNTEISRLASVLPLGTPVTISA
jgi:lipoprotein-anchoring transpeptidase ErfK/SrfK